MIAYKACIALINAGRTDGLADKIDLFFSFNRITEEQYIELMSMLPAAEK